MNGFSPRRVGVGVLATGVSTEHSMDDLWGNAWGSPEDDAKPTTWAISEKPRNDDLQEDDLAMPSWSTGPGIQWDEPSDTQTSLWSNANPHHTVQDRPLENSFDEIPLRNSRLAEPQGDNNSTVELPVEPESHSFSPPSPRAQRDDIAAPSPSREPDRELSPSPTPASPSPSPSPSPEPSPSSSLDAFGTFTIGAEHSDTAPFPTLGGPLGGQIDDNEWGSPWGSVSKDAEEGSAQAASDEWESAKLRQLEMDRRVVRNSFPSYLPCLTLVCTEATGATIANSSPSREAFGGRLARNSGYGRGRLAEAMAFWYGC